MAWTRISPSTTEAREVGGQRIGLLGIRGGTVDYQPLASGAALAAA